MPYPVSKAQSDIVFDSFLKKKSFDHLTMKVAQATTNSNQQPQKALVLYNPFSLDSLMAATLVVSCHGQFTASTKSHHFVDNHINIGNVDMVIAAGMEMNKTLLTNLLSNNPKLQVVLLGYRDSYEWLVRSEYVYHPKKWLSSKPAGFVKEVKSCSLYKKYQERITLLKPSDDYYGYQVTQTDNTLTKVAQFWSASLSGKTKLDLNEVCDLVANVYSKVGLEDKDQPCLNTEPEDKDQPFDLLLKMKADKGSVRRVKLFDLSLKLRSALSSSKPLKSLREMELTSNEDHYLAYKSSMEEMFSRSMYDQHIFAKVGTGYTVRMAQVGENVVNDLIILPSLRGKDVVMYTDIRRFRIWRVYSPDHNKAKTIAACLKPVATWSEGLFYCAATYADATS